jgi:UDPglucose 6-dehydrogenase
MNEFSALCEVAGGDIDLIRKGMASDQRIGKHFLYAGVGYGGSCFPKDVDAILDAAQTLSLKLNIIGAARDANQRQRQIFLDKILARLGHSHSGKTVAIWGLSYKPNTDDVREAPSLVIIPELLKRGIRVQAYDPIASENARSALHQMKIDLSHFQLCESAMAATEGADALVLLTEWNEFLNPDFTRLKLALKSPLLLDGRNQYDPATLRDLGWVYEGIGRS